MASSRQGGGRQQLPFALVLVGLAASFLYLLLEPGHWERGTGAIAASVLLAAAFRAILPTRHVGSLAVRSRWLDTVMYAGAALVILLVDLRLHS